MGRVPDFVLIDCDRKPNYLVFVVSEVLVSVVTVLGAAGLSTSLLSVLVTEPSAFSVVLVSFFTTVPSSLTSVLLECSVVSHPTIIGTPVNERAINEVITKRRIAFSFRKNMSDSL